MKKEMVGSVPGNVLGMIADLSHKLQHGVIVPVELGKFLKRQNPFAVPTDLIADWQIFWQELGSETDLSGLKIPAKQKDFDRLIVDVLDISLDEVHEYCQKLFPCWKWTDKNLSEVITHNDRSAKDGSYAIWFRNRVEADEELKDISANGLKKRNTSGITLKERLIYELKYFKETGKHLDVNNITLCSGSRYDDGHVPFVFWHDDEMRVRRYRAGGAGERLRSREAVS